jgi:hypothetical protein
VVASVVSRLHRFAYRSIPARRAGEELADFGLLVGALSLAALIALLASNPQIRTILSAILPGSVSP